MVAVMHSGDAPTAAEFHDAIAEKSDRWFAACLKITRNAAMAEDAVQDALVSAWTKRDQFQRGARLDTWIHRIAVNAALQLLRKHKPQVFEPLAAEPITPEPTPDVEHEQTELQTELQQALQALSDIERLCFVLKHLEQWRLREIAAELDVNVGTVKQALFRGVRKLRAQMPELPGRKQ